ncbi:PPR: pentatricopeptide repeat domain containing protein [Nitzschia inconspicua]|uniref:PPR: pentatricopeptide repeat domain containing protein n=1 Tax=Nitzschia inconspicua TaxID=303405 RepID=A0A9K3KPB5_9STRA|nr:PPR: pentatricopeptide repeat domain containing protein [Nitzschia inconspicua]
MRISILAISVGLSAVEPGEAFLCRSFRQSQTATLSFATVHDLENVITGVGMEEEVSIEDYTSRILRGEFEHDDIGAVLPILQAWCKQESVEGAEMTQKILLEMENHVDNGLFPGKSLRANHYAIAVNAWAKSGHEKSAEQAQNIFDRMEERGIKPNRIVFNSLMNAYSLHKDPEKVSELLNRMEQELPEEILTSDYNVLVSTYARQGDAKAAEKVVQQMVVRYSKEKSDCLPDLVSYNMILDAWARSDSESCGTRAEMILDAIEERENDPLVKPNIRSYVTAMTAVIRSGEENIVERVDAIWNRSKAMGIGDDPYLFSTVLDSYAVTGANDAATKVRNILTMAERMDIAKEEKTVIYNAALKVFKESRDDGASMHAEELFQNMLSDGTVDIVSFSTMIAMYGNQKYNKTIREKVQGIEKTIEAAGLTRSTTLINCLINFWIRCGDFARATSLLDEMEQAYKEGNDDLAPDVVSYTTIMNGWIKSSDSASIRKAEKLFQRQKEMARSGNRSAEPNFITYVALVEGIARSDQPNAAIRVERIVRDMYKKYENGESSSKPNAQMISSAINCWSKSGESDAGEHAESLLNWMIDIYESENDRNFEPNEFAFTSAISAWAKSRKFGKVQRAKALLDKMTLLYEMGKIRARPNDYCYTAVINACALCENDSIEKRDAMKVFVEVYKHIISGSDENLRPNHVTFSCAIGALRRLLPPSDERTAAVKKVFNKCLEEGMCHQNVITRLRSTVDDQVWEQLVGRNIASLDRQIQISDIPSEWRRNVV